MLAEKSDANAIDEIRKVIASKIGYARGRPGYRQTLDKFSRSFADSHNAIRYGNYPEWLTASETDDRALCDLPHPVRAIDVSRCEERMIYIFGPEIMADVWGMAKSESNMNEVLAMIKMAAPKDVLNAMFNAAGCGGVNDGALSASIYPVYHHFADGKIITVSDSAIRALQHTDIGDDVPCNFVRAPMTPVYLEFGETPGNMPITVSNLDTGLHEMQGVYLVERTAEAMSGSQRLNSILGIDGSKPTRIIDVMFVGRAKSSLLDDATHHMTIYIQDEAMSVKEMIDRHLTLYSSPTLGAISSGSHQFNQAIPTEENNREYRISISWLAKVLTYINLADARRTNVNDKSDLLKRIAGLGPKKASKLTRKLVGAYDHILIGSSDLDSDFGSGEGYASKRPHFRRGHIRMQRYGEGRALVKAVFIKPMIVNKDSLGKDHDVASSKNYIVK